MAGEGERIGIAERFRCEIAQPDRAASEAYRADIRKAQPGIADAHPVLRRAADQAIGQGWDQKAPGRDLIGRDAMLRDQPLQTVDATMRRAAGGEWLVA